MGGSRHLSGHHSLFTIHKSPFTEYHLSVHRSQVTVHRSQVTDYSLIWKLTSIFVTAFAPASLGLSVARLLMLTRNHLSPLSPHPKKQAPKVENAPAPTKCYFFPLDISMDNLMKNGLPSSFPLAEVKFVMSQ